MALNAHEKLDIFIIVYFSLALPFSLWVCKKQGFGRSLGWLYLVSLPIFRIAGSACTIAAYQDAQRPSPGLLAAGAILNGLGLVSLELTLLGLVERANAGMQNRFRYASRGLPMCHILLIIAAGLSISGGINSSESQSQSSVDTGHALRKGSAIELLAVFLILVAVTVGILVRVNQAWAGDRHILYAAAISFPFLLVRAIYTVIIAFATSSATFSATSPNVYVQAFMQILMECIIIALFIAAGLTVPSVRLAPEDFKEADPPGISQTNSSQAPNIQPGNDVELGTLPARSQGP
ncbi:hypothetical protein NA57DRAFT_73227 [Rhizodiscina lignyota]|uniref:DUF7702 domain-containing protein n=1 Tax=Rhizodiscina lignyota TaxID=1504668 RepID=A0A9P4M8K7_9PEZI|nr:hypothetical protein NA57DRAFT_73227 [Rhizodiscina lignyota]